MTDAARSPANRIILTATCYADAEAAIELGIWLARQTNGELVGLLVEEETILAYASHTSARILSSASNGFVAVNAETMRAAFHSDASAFRRRLADLVTSDWINWSFQVRPGRVFPVLKDVANAGDFILLGYQRPQQLAGDIILVVRDPQDMALVDVAKLLARERQRGLTVFLTDRRGTTGPSAVGPEDFESANLVRLSGFDELVARLGKVSSEAVIVGRQSSDDDLATILEAARCPIIVAV